MPAGMLYRWEDHNHGLEHKCGTCATVLSSPRAKKTCFGIHEEVCTRYHKTLFYVGQSHHCDACHKTIELHDKRHREIAALVQEVQRLDGSSSQLLNQRGKGRKKANLKLDLDALELGLQDAEDEGRETNWDNDSSTLNEEDVEERKQVWCDADVRKAAKAERKVAKNQVRFDVITKEDLDKIQNALHPAETKDLANEATQVPNGQGLVDNSTIDKNIVFNAHCFRWSSLRQRVHEKKVMKNNGPSRKVDPENAEQVDEISTIILKILGIKTNLAKAAKARKTLESKLRSAILNDLLAFENEQAETMQRMAGYWRYANRRTYNQMVENNELWDWATGAKLQKIEEESELDVIEEEDESLEGGNSEEGSPGLTPMTSPESCLDDCYELIPSNVPLFPRTIAHEEGDGFKTPTQATYATYSVDHGTFAEATRSGFENSHLPDLTYSPGRSPGPTHTFRVPSPSSSDDDPYHEDWDFIESPTEDGHIVRKASKIPRIPLSPVTPNAKGPSFHGKKDSRAPNKAVYIREASPPQTESAEPSPWNKAPSPTTIPPSSADVNNHFGNLDRDIPAPCDDQKVLDTPSKVKVLNLFVPPKNSSPVAEEGWEIQGAKGVPRKGDFPPLKKAQKSTHVARKVPAAPKKKTAISKPTQKAAGPGTTWAKVAAGRPKK